MVDDGKSGPPVSVVSSMGKRTKIGVVGHEKKAMGFPGLAIDQFFIRTPSPLADGRVELSHPNVQLLSLRVQDMGSRGLCKRWTHTLKHIHTTEPRVSAGLLTRDYHWGSWVQHERGAERQGVE